MIAEKFGTATVSDDLGDSPWENDLLRVGALGMAGRRDRLGAEMIRAYVANDHAAMRRAVIVLTKRIAGRKLGRTMATKISTQVIKEHLFDKCPTCGGTGTRMIAALKVVCHVCDGVSVARYSDTARARALELTIEQYRRAGWGEKIEGARRILTAAMATVMWESHRQLEG